MQGMTAAAKLKVSLTLSADLVALVDRHARRGDGSRSGVVEKWLRRAESASVQHEIEDATASYYRSLRGEDDAGSEPLSRALSDAAGRLAYDEKPAPRRRQARR
jgi:hypothetical protein